MTQKKKKIWIYLTTLIICIGLFLITFKVAYDIGYQRANKEPLSTQQENTPNENKPSN